MPTLNPCGSITDRITAKPEDVMPWKVLGQKWHMSKKGFPPGKKTAWKPEVLDELLEMLSEAVPGGQFLWNNQQLVHVFVPQQHEPWATIYTKRRTGLELLLSGPKGRFALGRVASLAAEREFLADRPDRDVVKLIFRSHDDLAAGDLESTQTLHQLRIAGKHLRYAFEVFIPALHESFREDFYPQLEEIQNLLGEIHDAFEATRVFRRTKKKWKVWRGTKRWERRGLSGFRWRELRSGLDSVLLAYAQQADHARTEFLDLWPGFSGESFRRPVAELLAVPAEPAEDRAVPDPGTGENTEGENPENEHLLPH
jgi:hypothetical protein